MGRRRRAWFAAANLTEGLLSLEWWRTQSRRTGLHAENSLLAGKMQGILPIPRRFRRK